MTDPHAVPPRKLVWLEVILFILAVMFVLVIAIPLRLLSLFDSRAYRRRHR